MRIRIFALAFFLSSFTFLSASAEDDAFFSPKRFSLKTEVIESFSGDGETQKSIKKFSEVFAKGADALDEGRLESAEKDLHLARDMWPEFFGADFLLALLYERIGNADAAARHYKSYLIKLRAFQDGSYGMSEPIMRSILLEKAETYDKAFGLVRDRLAAKGIVIDNVRPAADMPAFLYPSAVVLLFLVFYAVVCLWLLPRWRRHYRITHPPESFWVCPACLAENPDPNKVCQECGKERGVR